MTIDEFTELIVEYDKASYRCMKAVDLHFKLDSRYSKQKLKAASEYRKKVRNLLLEAIEEAKLEKPLTKRQIQAILAKESRAAAQKRDVEEILPSL